MVHRRNSPQEAAGHFETTVEIDAPVDRVWDILVDVERWPEWTASMTNVERLSGSALVKGATARIKQPRMPSLVWEVTEIEAGASFTWRTSSAGVTTVGSHVIRPAVNDRSAVTLGVDQSGPLAPLTGLLTSRLTRRYVEMEARGLKQRCEAS